MADLVEHGARVDAVALLDRVAARMLVAEARDVKDAAAVNGPRVIVRVVLGDARSAALSEMPCSTEMNEGTPSSRASVGSSSQADS